MQRVLFDTVFALDNKIFALVKSEEELDNAMDKYHTLLCMCGWEQTEYELELLTRIDKEWTRLLTDEFQAN
jgi:hypothetical protein